MNIYNFSNIIKYDYNKCTKCNQCIDICKTKALSLHNGKIVFKKEYCIACEKCIKTCSPHALYYFINDSKVYGANATAIIPVNADKKYLLNNYDLIYDTKIGEKIKVIETAFEMEKKTSQLINDEIKETLIISDIDNIDLILKNQKTNIYNYLSKIKNHYYLTSYICRLNSKNKNLKIAFFGIPFQQKMFFENMKMVDELCDIPFKPNKYYSPLDTLLTYMELCKLKPSIQIENLDFKKTNIIKLTNKYLSLNVLITNNIEYLLSCNYLEYDFILILEKDYYTHMENLLKDEEINKIYKAKLKAPLNTLSFFRKE